MQINRLAVAPDANQSAIWEQGTGEVGIADLRYTSRRHSNCLAMELHKHYKKHPDCACLMTLCSNITAHRSTRGVMHVRVRVPSRRVDHQNWLRVCHRIRTRRNPSIGVLWRGQRIHTVQWLETRHVTAFVFVNVAAVDYSCWRCHIVGIHCAEENVLAVCCLAMDDVWFVCLCIKADQQHQRLVVSTTSASSRMTYHQ